MYTSITTRYKRLLWRIPTSFYQIYVSRHTEIQYSFKNADLGDSVITALAPNERSFLKNRQDGGSGTEEEADLPQVHLPRRRPWPAAGHVLWATDAAIQCAPAPAAEPRLRREQHSLLKRLRKAQKDAPPMEKPEVWRRTCATWSFCPRRWAAWWASTTARPSTRWKASLRWSATTWASSPSPTSPWNTAGQVSGLPIPPASSPSSNLLANKSRDFSQKKKKRMQICVLELKAIWCRWAKQLKQNLDHY